MICHVTETRLKKVKLSNDHWSREVSYCTVISYIINKKFPRSSDFAVLAKGFAK